MTTEELHILISIQDKRLTVSDAREFFHGCIPGWKTFSDLHNFNWVAVTRHGLLASQLMATQDAMAISLVNYIYSKDTSNG